MPTTLRLYSVIPRPVDPEHNLVLIGFEEDGPNRIRIKAMRSNGEPVPAGNLLTITVDDTGGLYVIAHPGVAYEIPLAADAHGERCLAVSQFRRRGLASVEEPRVPPGPQPPQQHGGVSTLGSSADWEVTSTPTTRRRP